MSSLVLRQQLWTKANEFFYANSYRITGINFLLSVATGYCQQTKTIIEEQINISVPRHTMGRFHDPYLKEGGL